jgi:ABC-2 type transport system permease protein
VIRLVLLDAKIAVRTLSAMLGDRPARTKLLILGAILVLMHAIAGYVAVHFAPDETTVEGARQAEIAARSATLLLLPWTTAATLTTVTRWLYQRGDLDLILASPLSPRRFVAARILSQGLESIAALAVLLLPFAHASAALGRPHWLAIYPALGAAGLIGASLGFLLALKLFFVFGARRARLYSQIAATLIGASAVLVAQALAFVPDHWRQALYAAFSTRAATNDWLGQLIEIPERAAMGEFPALVAWAGVAFALWAIAVLLRGNAFVAAAMASAGSPADAPRVHERIRFTASPRAALRRKEHRLLWRDPWLLSQMLMQALYTLPVGIVLWRHGGPIGQPGVAFGPMIVVIAGQFSGSLAWLALSAEDSPDTLRTAPATRGEIERAKLSAILQPVGLTLLPVLVGLAMLSPWGAFCAGLAAVGSATSGALLMLWRQAPARRGMVLRRHSQSKLLALGEHWLSLLWASINALAAFHSVAFVAPLALVGLTLWLIRPAAPKALGVQAVGAV